MGGTRPRGSRTLRTEGRPRIERCGAFLLCREVGAATLFIMSEMEIVQSAYHSNGRAAPFYAALVDDPKDGDMKLVIIFDEPDYCAVLSLDVLVQDEDVSVELNGWRGDKYEEILRDVLWDSEE